jgi:hypothetical protein
MLSSRRRVNQASPAERQKNVRKTAQIRSQEANTKRQSIYPRGFGLREDLGSDAECQS